MKSRIYFNKNKKIASTKRHNLSHIYISTNRDDNIHNKDEEYTRYDDINNKKKEYS